MIFVTGVVNHKSHRIGWRQTRHTYLIDAGYGIEIQQVEVSPLFENILYDPPFPQARYFEVEIDEIRSKGNKNTVFNSICPVKAHKKPDLHILRFRIRRGKWTVHERYRSLTPNGEVQWIYTDDFNLLYLSSGGRYDASMLMALIVSKLDTIVQSVASGTRIPSEFENQVECRTAFDSIFADGINSAFRDTVLYKDHSADFPSGQGTMADETVSSAEIGRHHGHARVPAGQVHVDIDKIDDLNDLSWLND